MLGVFTANVVLGGMREEDHVLLELTSSSHGRDVIYNELNSVEEDRECIEKSRIKYYLKALSLGKDEHEASECRLNLSQRFHSIVTPEPQIHQLVHNETNRLMMELETKLVSRMKTLPNMQSYEFYNFEDLNYGLQCSCGFQELCQVKLQENVVEAVIEKVVEVSPACGPRVKGRVERILLNIPLNGTFECQSGRSPTCKRTTAKTTNAHYKIIDN